MARREGVESGEPPVGQPMVSWSQSCSGAFLPPSLFFPFAIAARKPTRLDDIERLREGGLASVLHLLRYSPLTGVIQGLLNFVGAVLVPVGTLARLGVARP